MNDRQADICIYAWQRSIREEKMMENIAVDVAVEKMIEKMAVVEAVEVQQDWGHALVAGVVITGRGS